MQARHDQVRPIVEQPLSRSLKLFTGIWRRGIYYWIEVLFMGAGSRCESNAWASKR